jgi:hypothetical protein
VIEVPDTLARPWRAADTIAPEVAAPPATFRVIALFVLFSETLVLTFEATGASGAT